MIAQFPVQLVELLARDRAHVAGERKVLPLAAGAHSERRRVEIWSVALHHLDHRLRKPGLRLSHDLDGEIAGEGENERIVFRHGRGHASPWLCTPGTARRRART